MSHTALPGADVPPVDAPRVRVAVVGAGFAGLATAIRLRQAGIDDFVVLERADDVGGAWRDNTYPGCACDVPSTLYSLTSSPNPDWSAAFAPQQEIHNYLRDCVHRHGLGPHLRLGHDLHAAHWDDLDRMWTLRTSRGPLRARVLVSATGQLSEPAIPALPGLDRFGGRAFHSARWDHDHRLDGARVAVVGTGASSVQFVPQIAPRVARLHVFQRSAAWVIPRRNRARGPAERSLARRVPGVGQLSRALPYWSRELSLTAFTTPSLMRTMSLWARLHLHRQVPEPGLRAALTPDYTMGCKRVLASSEYYPTLREPHVELITTGIREIREHSVLCADGTERPVDTLIFGTGFRATESPVAALLHGRDGRTLAAHWATGAQAYLGTAVTGFPNLFLLTGPNSGLGHNSALLGIEAQAEYIVDAVRTLGGGDVAVEVRPETQARFVARARDRLARTVWSRGGCGSWFLDDAGRNTTLWPWSTAELRRATRRFDVENYAVRTRELVGAAPPG